MKALSFNDNTLTINKIGYKTRKEYQIAKLNHIASLGNMSRSRYNYQYERIIKQWQRKA